MEVQSVQEQKPYLSRIYVILKPWATSSILTMRPPHFPKVYHRLLISRLFQPIPERAGGELRTEMKTDDGAFTPAPGLSGSSTKKRIRSVVWSSPRSHAVSSSMIGTQKSAFSLCFQDREHLLSFPTGVVFGCARDQEHGARRTLDFIAAWE